MGAGRDPGPVGNGLPSLEKSSVHMPLCTAQTALGGENSNLSTIFKQAY